MHMADPRMCLLERKHNKEPSQVCFLTHSSSQGENNICCSRYNSSVDSQLSIVFCSIVHKKFTLEKINTPKCNSNLILLEIILKYSDSP